MRASAIIGLLGSLVLAGPFASAGELELSVRVQPEVVRIAEPVSVTVDVVHDRGEAPRFAAFQASDVLWEGAPRRVVTLDLDDEPGRALTQLRYSLVGIEPGEQAVELPGAMIEEQGAIRTVAVPPAEFRILGELAEGEDEPRPLAGFPESPEARPSAMSLAALAAGLLFLGFWGALSVFLVFRLGRRGGSPVARKESAVAQLLELGSVDEAQARDAFGLASRAVREALDLELGEALPGLTDEEWVERRSVAKALPPARLERAAALLRTAERVKYGMEQPTRWAVDELLTEARGIVTADPSQGGEA